MGKKSREKLERRSQTENQQKLKIRNRTGFETILLAIITLGTYLALFAPLVINKAFFFPFVVPKTVFFRSIVDILFVFYILLAIYYPRYRPKINALTISIILFLAVSIFTSFTGIDFARSFWSTFERMTGILTFLHLFVFYIVLTSCFKERKDWERILTVAIVVGILLSFYIFMAKDAATRGGGTVGNISFLAAYMLFDIFFAIILFFTKNWPWRIFYGAAAVIMSAVLMFAPEWPRGGIAAYLVGAAVLFFGYLWFSRVKLFKILAPALLVLMILIGVAVSQTSIFQQRFMDIKELPGEARKIVWHEGYEGWQEKFWLGWGQENFNITFSKYFNPALPLTFDVWYDRVHMIILDIAVASGIFGVLSYLAIFGVAIYGLLRTCPKVREVKNIFLPLGAASLLVVYFVQNIFVFDMISSYMMFFLSLAFAYFLLQQGTMETVKPEIVKNKGMYSFLGGFLIILAFLALYFGNIQPARASHYTVESIIFPLEKSMVSFRNALNASSMSTFEAPEQFAKKVSDLAFDQKQDRKTVLAAFVLAAEELEKSIERSPRDFRLYLVAGRLYNDFFYFFNDKKSLDLAEKYLTKAIELSPGNQQAYWTLAQTMLAQGKHEEVIQLLQKAVDLEPRFSQSHWVLGSAYKILGANELALAEFKEAENTGYNWRTSPESLQRVIEVYQAMGNEEALADLYPLAIKINPKNAQNYAALAVTYANLGKFSKARELAKEALRINPALASQTEEFLNSLPEKDLVH